MIDLKFVSLAFSVNDEYLIKITDGGQYITNVGVHLSKADNLDEIISILDNFCVNGTRITYKLYKLQEV